jgi:hypothetical protein
MKYIDFGIQTLLLAIFLVYSILGLIDEGTFNAIIFAAFYIGMFLGPWQMLSSFLSIIFKSEYHSFKLIHFFSALIYIVLLSFSTQLRSEEPSVLVSVLLSLPAVALAVFYYSLTWRWVFRTQTRSSFLPNTNF